jgi:hypothetical protein
VTKISAAQIFEQLLSRGATAAQAGRYINLIRKFERESSGKGELHHILPKNSGWWKRFENTKWNHARVEWHLHIALHAYLAHIFPENNKLLDALRATTMRRHKNDRHRTQIIRWYQNGKTGAWIAKRIGVRACTIINRLHRWGVSVRPSGHSVVAAKLQKQKHKIIQWYVNRQSTMWIAKRVDSSERTIARYLKIWGIKVRSCCEVRFLDHLNAHRKEIVDWYSNRKTAQWMGEKMGVSKSTIYKYLTIQGVERHVLRGKLLAGSLH